MFRLSSQACEYFDMSDRELFGSDLWNALMIWLKDNNQVPCCDPQVGESVNFELIDQFVKSSDYLFLDK